MDAYTYDVVEIGNQCWFAENLRTTAYANGDNIIEVTNQSTWAAASYGARCSYANDASNIDPYGRLYNWHAVNDARGLCPTGWHVPSESEWLELRDHALGEGISFDEVGDAFRSTTGWSGGNGTDNFGFGVLPAGYRAYEANPQDGIWLYGPPSGTTSLIWRSGTAGRRSSLSSRGPDASTRCSWPTACVRRSHPRAFRRCSTCV